MQENVIVGQSGGPTAVINSSLSQRLQDGQGPRSGRGYGMLHGIQGLWRALRLSCDDH